MRHKKDHRHLGRRTEERIALMRALSRSLILHGRIRTTTPKAKEARRYVEKLVTLAKDGSLTARRRALSMLPEKPVVKKLFDTIAPLLADRNGGYTRIVHLPFRRKGDAGAQSFLEFVVPIPRTTGEE
ncbi:MAG: 50S ribosomal protein L17 [Planctomycetota bacterium]|nr:50S ribosomal protein L17 [Planctomycetota bacterium]